jgi:L-amino acid N-acyltransferase YncA
MTPETTGPEPTVQPMEERHWPEVAAIYRDGIDTGHATFATAPPASWGEFQRDHLLELCLVAAEGSRVLGWAALSAVSGRCVYAGVAEVSIYVAASSRGRGIGLRLFTALIERSETHDIWTLQAGIFPENIASIALHRRAGFDAVGLRHRLGKMAAGPLAGRWRDVLLMERRSARAGVG